MAVDGNAETSVQGTVVRMNLVDGILDHRRLEVRSYVAGGKAGSGYVILDESAEHLGWIWPDHDLPRRTRKNRLVVYDPGRNRLLELALQGRKNRAVVVNPHRGTLGEVSQTSGHRRPTVFTVETAARIRLAEVIQRTRRRDRKGNPTGRWLAGRTWNAEIVSPSHGFLGRITPNVAEKGVIEEFVSALASIGKRPIEGCSYMVEVTSSLTGDERSLTLASALCVIVFTDRAETARAAWAAASSV